MAKRKCEFLFIDGDAKECDFCDKEKICAVIDWMGNAMVICQDCLQEFLNKFKDNSDE